MIVAFAVDVAGVVVVELLVWGVSFRENRVLCDSFEKDEIKKGKGEQANEMKNNVGLWKKDKSEQTYPDEDLEPSFFIANPTPRPTAMAATTMTIATPMTM